LWGVGLLGLSYIRGLKNNNMKNKIQYGITYFFIGIVAVACLFFSGCNGSKRAVKKLAVIDSKHKTVVDGYFAMTRPCKDSTDVRVIYKEGKTVIDTVVDVQLDIIKDTVYKTVTKYVTKLQRDTITETKYVQQTDKSKIGELEGINAQLRDEKEALKSELAAKQKTIDFLMWATIILGAYTLLRWVLRYFTKGKIKLP
jgi:hypothetical protein